MTRPGGLRFFYDYVDPLSYLLHLRAGKAERGGSPLAEPIPFELNPPPHPLLRPDADGWRERWEGARKEPEGADLPESPPWIIPWSRKAHELALFAAEQGVFGRIHESLFRAYLIEGQDIGRVDILLGLARDGGLDVQEAKGALDVDLFRDGVEERRRQALAAGVRAPPCLLAPDGRAFGMPTPEEVASLRTSGIGDG